MILNLQYRNFKNSEIRMFLKIIPKFIQGLINYSSIYNKILKTQYL